MILRVMSSALSSTTDWHDVAMTQQIKRQQLSNAATGTGLPLRIGTPVPAKRIMRNVDDVAERFLR